MQGRIRAMEKRLHSSIPGVWPRLATRLLVQSLHSGLERQGTGSSEHRPWVQEGKRDTGLDHPENAGIP